MTTLTATCPDPDDRPTPSRPVAVGTRKDSGNADLAGFRNDQNQLTRQHPLAKHRLQERVEAIAAEHGEPEPSPAVVSMIRQDQLAEIYFTNRPQPLGITLYPSASLKDKDGRAVNNELYQPPKHKGPYETVYSNYYPLGVYTHPTANGDCVHEMFVDDGGVYSVEPDPVEGWLIKTARAECLSSVDRRQDDHPELWGSRETWQVPCPAGDWQFTTEWNPSPTRYTAESQEKDRAPADMAKTEARPVSRKDTEKFAATGHYRNVSESHNNWFKRTLPHRGRAATLKQRSQEFDFFAGACLTNAITWARSRE